MLMNEFSWEIYTYLNEHIVLHQFLLIKKILNEEQSQVFCKISFWHIKDYESYETNVAFFPLLLEHQLGIHLNIATI